MLSVILIPLVASILSNSSSIVKSTLRKIAAYAIYLYTTMTKIVRFQFEKVDLDSEIRGLKKLACIRSNVLKWQGKMVFRPVRVLPEPVGAVECNRNLQKEESACAQLRELVNNTHRILCVNMHFSDQYATPIQSIHSRSDIDRSTRELHTWRAKLARRSLLAREMQIELWELVYGKN